MPPTPPTCGEECDVIEQDDDHNIMMNTNLPTLSTTTTCSSPAQFVTINAGSSPAAAAAASSSTNNNSTMQLISNNNNTNNHQPPSPHRLGLHRCESFHGPLVPNNNGRFEPPSWSTPSGGPGNDSNIALHIIKNGDVIKTLKFSDGRRYTLFGRCPAVANENDGGAIERLEHPTVSRTHAAIIHSSGGSLFIVDLGSSHGTLVSGIRLVPYEVTPIRDRAVILFGASSRRYIVRVYPSLIMMSSVQPPPLHFASSLTSSNNSGIETTSEDMEDAEVTTHTRMNCVPDFAPVFQSRSPNRLFRRVSFSCMAPEVIPCPPTSHPSSPLPLPLPPPPPVPIHQHRQTSPRSILVNSNSASSRQLFVGGVQQQPSLTTNGGFGSSDDSESSCDSFSPLLLHTKRPQPSSPVNHNLTTTTTYSSTSSSSFVTTPSKRFCSGSM
jgi:pSer/pThr/pTyr-binding forkhead associated (FHA) protein